MAKSKLKHKVIKRIDGVCPDCEEKSLHLVNIENYIYTYCDKCEYTEFNEHENKKKMKIARDFKNGKDKVSSNGKTTESRDRKNVKTGSKKSWR